MVNTRLFVSLIVFLSITLSSVSFSQVQVLRQLAGSGGGAINQASNNLRVNSTISQTAIALDVESLMPPSFVAQGFWSFLPIFLSVENQTQKEVKKVITNYPNPVNNFTTFTYNLDKAARVSLKIYDITGQEIATLVDEYQTEGEKKIEWNVRGNDGLMVSSGTYLYELSIMNSSSTNSNYNLRNILVITR